ncbi:quorum-sensing autoinducer CAI-1 synthase [Burkholderia seminalis]|uniref:alpha-hydroxyketone-type quorum-sensing autoinducer synthase n=1 Tax=Burkholderia seminalis TaxID=488731 RepID=UPI001CF4139C|nr:alpha-hydroxyketone-type quorum-sensing autoinducer synthase [Burkholderia seminalis]MCA8306837.1 quorum-sensing autoinducer CAI-1 synthase [Burkholderia seminalis]MCA8435423.1 quorum-sensing autoinducer CAI-1 synthase [Burkholderia seminalis]
MYKNHERKFKSNVDRDSLPEFVAERVAHYYRERVQRNWGGGHIMRGRMPGPDALHLSSNDYLSIARHPDILESMCASIQSEGNGMLMSGIFLHGACPLLELEDKFAYFMGSESAILCQSGYAANIGLLQSIASTETPVYLDMMAHMSLWEGVQSSGAKAIAFAHNDVDHLVRQVRRYGSGIIVVDSIYSTNGSVCPLVDVAEVATTAGCVLVVDESHSLGTHGPDGSGLVVELGLTGHVHFRTASLAKAFAGRAGVITCSSRFQEYFKFESRPAIFSSTLLPHEAAALETTIRVIEKETWRRTQVAENARYLREQLMRLGYNLNGSETQIIALESGTEQRTIKLRDALESHGIYGSVFCAPATAKNHALIRLSVHAALTRDELRRIIQVAEVIREEVELDEWPSTQRTFARAATIDRIGGIRQPV